MQLPSDPASGPSLRIDGRTVSPSLNRIGEGSGCVQVEPRVMHVLVCLASRPGAVISRRELLDTVWPKVVVKEEALTHVISQLRRAFDDDPRNPRIIETIRKGGYRLIASVEDDLSPATVLGATAKPGLRPGRLALIAFVAVAALVLLRGFWPDSPAPGPLPLLDARPFTSLPGNELHPALSPVGDRIAFSWGGEKGGDYRIYIKQPGSESLLRLTDGAVWESRPCWSPDGERVAFVASTDSSAWICVVPALGGVARRIGGVHKEIRGIDWSPDGKLIAYARREHYEKPWRLFLLNVADASESQLTHPLELLVGDMLPRFSPDGKQLAFVQGDRTNFQNIHLMPVAGGSSRQLTHSQVKVRGLDWSADGMDLVFAASPDGSLELWRLAVKSGELRVLPTRGGSPFYPSLAAGGSRLVYQELQQEGEIWRCGLPRTPADEVEIAALIQSTRIDWNASYSPDGSRILFLSDRSGKREIWICDPEGKGPHQLTQLDGAYIFRPRWSPQSDRIAFDAAYNDTMQIFVMEVDGGEVRQVTQGKHHHRLAHWSRDGRWIYYSVDEGDHWQFWRVGVDGRSRERVRTLGCISVYESADSYL